MSLAGNSPPTSVAVRAEKFSGSWRVAFPALLMISYAAQCAWFIRTQSLTYDEPVHIAEGLNAWRYGRFEQYNDHPPLARLWCSLPLLDRKWQVEVQKLPDSFRVTRIAPDPESLAWRARAMNVLLGLLLAWLVWRAADRLFSRGRRKFRARPVCLLPLADRAFFDCGHRRRRYAFYFRDRMGSGALAAVDPHGKERSGLGLLLGLMLLAKFSTAPMFVLALLWMLLLGTDK